MDPITSAMLFRQVCCLRNAAKELANIKEKTKEFLDDLTEDGLGEAAKGRMKTLRGLVSFSESGIETPQKPDSVVARLRRVAGDLASFEDHVPAEEAKGMSLFINQIADDLDEKIKETSTKIRATGEDHHKNIEEAIQTMETLASYNTAWQEWASSHR